MVENTGADPTDLDTESEEEEAAPGTPATTADAMSEQVVGYSVPSERHDHDPDARSAATGTGKVTGYSVPSAPHHEEHEAAPAPQDEDEDDEELTD